MNNKPKVLIIGATGEIGLSVFEYLKKKGFEVYGTSRKINKSNHIFRLDINDKEYNLHNINFDMCLFLGGINNIKECEEKVEECRETNVLNTIRLINYLVKNDIYVVFLSSNRVFSGSNDVFDKNDKTKSSNNYGRFKIEVENFIKSYKKNKAVILRATKVISEESPIIKKWSYEISQGREIYAYSNVFISPISLEKLNKVIYDILNTREHRIYQLGGSREISYYQLAKNYFNKNLSSKPKIIPIKLEEKNSFLLNNIKLKSFIP